MLLITSINNMTCSNIVGTQFLVVVTARFINFVFLIRKTNFAEARIFYMTIFTAKSENKRDTPIGIDIIYTGGQNIVS